MQLQTHGPETSALPVRINAWLGTGAVLALAAWLSYRDGGYFTSEYLMAAIAGWTLVGLIVIASWDALELPRASIAPLVMLAAVMLSTGASIAWSISPNSSLQEFSRVAIYLAVFIAVLAGARTRISVSRAAAIFVVLATAVSVFALLAKIIPAYSEDYTYAGGRLMGSIGYWNALAIFMVLSMLPCLWFSVAPAVRSVWKVAATAALALMALTLFFTLSRGGILIGTLAVLAYLVLAPRRLGMLLSLAAAGIPAAALAWRTYAALPSLTAAEEGARIDAAEGRQFGMMLFVAIVAAALLKAMSLWLPDRLPATRNGRILIAVSWCLIVLAAAGVLFSQRERISAWVDSSRNGGEQTTASGDLSIENRGVGRLTSTSDQRTELWRIGIQNFTEHPVLGTGAATYRFANLRLQSGVGLARDPHSLWIRFLSDQGIVGMALLLGLVGTLAFALIGPLWSDRGLRHDGLYLGLLIACAAWLADSSLEWNWEMPVMSVVFFLLSGLALRLGAAGGGDVRVQAAGPAAPGGGTPVPVWMRMTLMGAAMALTLIFLALLASFSFTERARDSLDAGDFDAALTEASRARKLNPFATEPLMIEADNATDRGDYVAARNWTLDAIELEPERSSLYEELALLEFYDLKLPEAGIASLGRAIDADPQYRRLHLLLHRLHADAETYQRTGEMPPERALGR